MSIYVLAFLIGVVAGLRAMTAPAVVSWAARLGWLHLRNTPLTFLGSAAAPYIFSALAIGGKDLPIALLEDAIAIGGALLIVR